MLFFPFSHTESSTFIFSLSFSLANRLKGRVPLAPVISPHRRASQPAAPRRAQQYSHPAKRFLRELAGSKISKIFQKSANFWRARSRLYQNEILQENMRLAAFFKICQICILLHRCNLKILAKNQFEKSAIFVQIQQKLFKCCKIYKFLPIFKIFN